MALRSCIIVLAATACVAPPEGGEVAQRITGGTVATGDGAVVALVATAQSCGGEDEVFCTGTLVGPRAVVTAAHCLDYAPPGTLQVHFGGDARDGASGRRIEVVAAYAHPAATMTTHDIAVLELAETASETPVPLLDGAMDSSHIGAQVRIVGFGLDDAGDRGVKREGTATIATVDAETFALTPAPSNTCVGDSGGPVLLQVGQGEVLAGVTSFGDPSCVVSATNTRVDTNRASFVDGQLAAVAAAPIPGARGALGPGASLCASECTGFADCPAGTACVGGQCGLAGREPGRLVGTCAGDAECASGVCTASCECYEPCDDCDGGCAAAGGQGSGALPWLFLLLVISWRSRR